MMDIDFIILRMVYGWWIRCRLGTWYFLIYRSRQIEMVRPDLMGKSEKSAREKLPIF